MIAIAATSDPRNQNADVGDRLPVVVIGAGAAGFMAALSAAHGPRPVVLLEGTEQPGRKILISGGGRCNVLPSAATPDDFVTDGSHHNLRKILRAWPLPAVRRFFEEDLALPLRLEPETGKLFPVANRARDVLDALLSAADRAGVHLRTSARVTGLEPGSPWRVLLASGECLLAAAVVLATGGLSVPATGSDGTGLRLVQTLGHSLVPPYPALVPLTGDNPAHHALAGISLPVTLTAPAPPRAARDRERGLIQSRGGFLFTHRGYSGPAVLNIAHIAVRATYVGGPRPPIWVQWGALDAEGWEAELRRGRGSILSLLRGHLPERLALQLLAETGLAGVDLSQLSRENRGRLVEALAHYPLPWQGHEGYRTAEVTGGGVPLAEVYPATLASRVRPGLYLCGEILDAFGPIGGYNFLWAWVTGRSAGLAAGAG
ncbi:MAG TPA: aminoacetone oxidase family FAD-binding enzyme [Anaerolineae bacterium]